jgi:hypothetical protein
VSLFTQPCECQGLLYMTLHLGTAALCQPFAAGLGKSGGDCFVQFLSADNGQTWQRLQLPAVSPSEVGDPVLTDDFVVEDKYVYSTIEDRCACSGTPAAPRIVVSTNGLGPWRTVDDGLEAKGLGADFMSGEGSMIFAVVEPVDPSTHQPLSASPPYTAGHLQLYFSTLAGASGASWTLLGDVPDNSVDTMRVAALTLGQDNLPLIYLTSSFDATTPDAPATRLSAPVLEYAEVDGGPTLSWKTTPSAGIPSGDALLGNASGWAIGPLAATLPDGTVLAFFTAPRTGSPDDGKTAIFAWKPGAAAWQQEGGLFSAAAVTSLLVVTQANGDGTLVPYALYLTTDSGVLGCQLS